MCRAPHSWTTLLYLNKFIISINETAQKSFVIQREQEIEYEYHGPIDDLSTSTSIPLPPTSEHILTDMLLKRTGTCTSIFSDDLLKLHYLLKLYGFQDVSNCIRECKIMLSHHLLNGDCTQFDHLCQGNVQGKLPDCEIDLGSFFPILVPPCVN